MRLLILGGTRFLGRHLAQQALDAGHAVTLLHRGRSGPALFPQAQHLVGDRNTDLAGLVAAGRWDVCIDTSAYVPRHVRTAAAALAGRVDRYQLVSTISVYVEPEGPVAGTDEDAPRQVLDDPATEAVTGETYGGLKALCEDAALAGFGDRCLIARPGLLVGPHDPTGRFTWWVQRFLQAADGTRSPEVLAPGDPDAPVQIIDARDAAAWLLRQATDRTVGTFNLAGPEAPMSIADLLATARDTLAPMATLRWVDEALLLARGIAPWTGIPLWLPRAASGLNTVHIGRALRTGLRCRPLDQTLRDTVPLARAVDDAAPAAPPGGPPRPAVGLAPETEAALLAEAAAPGAGAAR